MKIRLRANTIRLRLLKGEVAQLASGQPLIETLPTPKPLHFAVVPADVPEMQAEFTGDTLQVLVPRGWSVAWAETEEVGRQATTNGIDILIEKDWACTTPRPGEEGLDTYSNPQLAPAL